MRALAIACYVIAAVAETGGLLFAVLALRENRVILRRWVAANPEGHEKGSYGQAQLLNQVVPALLGAGKWRARLAVLFIAVGIVAGTIGNFTGLPG